MAPGAPPRAAHHHFPAAQGDVFRAALETVRSMPGWEVLTAHPETGEIHARSRGRLFSPTMEHELRLVPTDAGTDLEMVSKGARQDVAKVDEKTLSMFEVLLEDRVARGVFAPLDSKVARQ